MTTYTFTVEHVRPGDKLAKEIDVQASSPEHARTEVELYIYRMGGRPDWYRWELTHIDGRPADQCADAIRKEFGIEG